MLTTLLTTLLVLNGFLLILLIIVLQQGNEGGIGSAFGVGNTAGFFGASGGVTLIVRTTWVAGILFFTLSTLLAWNKTHSHFGVAREIDKIQQSAPPASVPPSEAAPSAAPKKPVSEAPSLPATQP